MDGTSQRIVDATMALVRDKGYVATTTKDIAREASVNECTLFRKFGSKKDIVLAGMEQEKWRGSVTPDIFQRVRWDLALDLEMFMTEYMTRITPDFVRLSIGLRAPQIYEETAPLIMKVPQAFVAAFEDYLRQMVQKGLLAPEVDIESLAMTVFASTFGFTFLQASFGQALTPVDQERFIKQTVQTVTKGLSG